MRSRVPLFFFALAVTLFAFPYFAHAGIPFFGPIIPSSWDRCPANWNGLIIVANNIISLLLTLAIVVVAPLTIGYGGFKMVMSATNPGAKEEARSMIQNVIIGIVVALAAWLIVDAVLVALTGTGISYWNVVTGSQQNPCLDIKNSLSQSQGGGQIYGSGTTTVSVVSPSTAPPSEAAIRQQFANAGVLINHSVPCNPYDLNGVDYGCTNVGGMLPSTVAQVIDVATACKAANSSCQVTVTGGSEVGHATGPYSHGNGYKVDLSQNNAALNSYLQTFKLTGTRGGDSGGPIRVDSCGQNQYVQESNHWDITVYGECANP